MDYETFLEEKSQLGGMFGFKPLFMPDWLFGFQSSLLNWSVELWSNPMEVVFTPFMGVGSEVYGALVNNRRAIGVELKPAYYKQAVDNVESASIGTDLEFGGEGA